VDLLKPGSVTREASSGRFRGLVLAGGPGDPRRLEEAAAAARAALGRLPVLGIGLGHQVLALALGGKVGRMKLGHHGVNHPVRELASGRCQITVQSHSFVVEEQGLPATVEVTYRNVNDGTVEGLRSRDGAARSVQFHPTGDEMGRPSAVLAGFLEG